MYHDVLSIYCDRVKARLTKEPSLSTTRHKCFNFGHGAHIISCGWLRHRRHVRCVDSPNHNNTLKTIKIRLTITTLVFLPCFHLELMKVGEILANENLNISQHCLI